jgi:hypothetical protein
MKSIICIFIFFVALEFAESNQWFFRPRNIGNFIKLNNVASSNSNAIAINTAPGGSANAVSVSRATNVNTINQTR